MVQIKLSAISIAPVFALPVWEEGHTVTTLKTKDQVPNSFQTDKDSGTGRETIEMSLPIPSTVMGRSTPHPNVGVGPGSLPVQQTHNEIYKDPGPSAQPARSTTDRPGPVVNLGPFSSNLGKRKHDEISLDQGHSAPSPAHTIETHPSPASNVNPPAGPSSSLSSLETHPHVDAVGPSSESKPLGKQRIVDNNPHRAETPNPNVPIDPKSFSKKRKKDSDDLDKESQTTETDSDLGPSSKKPRNKEAYRTIKSQYQRHLKDVAKRPNAVIKTRR